MLILLNQYNMSLFSLSFFKGYNSFFTHRACSQFLFIIVKYVHNYLCGKLGTPFNIFIACTHCIWTVFTVHIAQLLGQKLWNTFE